MPTSTTSCSVCTKGFSLSLPPSTPVLSHPRQAHWPSLSVPKPKAPHFLLAQPAAPGGQRSLWLWVPLPGRSETPSRVENFQLCTASKSPISSQPCAFTSFSAKYEAQGYLTGGTSLPIFLPHDWLCRKLDKNRPSPGSKCLKIGTKHCWAAATSVQ